ncbi:4-(cytidine 5'-diphospho)-2-C-methyl-D-erythritol kinase [Roseomonas sp. F4]
MSAADPGFAPAKVNLYLRVTGRRADGFHLLDSLAVFAGVGDRVTATVSDALELTLAGPEAGALAAEPDNLVLRAARALAQATGVTRGAALRLEKHLPVASGIGGGSADAAAALRVLAALWGVSADLPALAAGLGADVPVCVTGQPARMRGVGEVLSPVPTLPPCGLLLANPRLPLATPAVFRARQGGFAPEARLPSGWADAADLADWLRPLGNDLQDAAISLCPPVAEVLAAIAAQPGCLLARMSGSGATCFGIFATAEAASQAAATLPEDWWRWGGRLLS